MPADGLGQRWLIASGRSHIVQRMDDSVVRTMCGTDFIGAHAPEIVATPTLEPCKRCMVHFAEDDALSEDESLTEAIGRGYRSAPPDLLY